jgi:RHS repeat-associated protein
MARKTAGFISQPIYLLLLSIFIIACTGRQTFAQSSFDKGTPAESKGGTGSASTYAMDKIETVNLANGNLSISIPLVTIGGRGSAAYTLVLSYNSKVWSGEHTTEFVQQGEKDSGIPPETVEHYSAKYDEAVMERLNSLSLGGGWSILKGPWMKDRHVLIDPVQCSEDSPYRFEIGCYKYVLTREWLVLPDGSEVEMRDSLTEGAPYLLPNPNFSQMDRNRGNVWHSVDGSNITLVSDANGSWILMPDGSRIRTSNNQTKMYDREGNYITIDYDAPSTGNVTYTDQLGRQVVLASASGGGATITAKGYNGLSDRVMNVNMGVIGALNGSGIADNLRSDYRSLYRPFTSGDAFRSYSQGYQPHAITTAHTDLFIGSEGGENIDEYNVVTSLSLLDGRSFRFRYNQYGEVAEVIYPGGGMSRIDYQGGQTTQCEAYTTFNDVLNRTVSKRKVLTDGVNVDATWTYGGGSGNVNGNAYPYATVDVRQGDDNPSGQLLLSEKHYFLAVNAEYRVCTGFTSNGTGNEKWQNAKEFRTERQTGNGTEVTIRNWAQRAPVVWGNDPGLSYNTYAGQHGQEQPPNDPRVTYEDTILEDGKMKRVEYGYDQFNNVTSIKEYDFGTEGNPGAFLRETVRLYAGDGTTPSVNGYCYTNLNPSDSTCGSGVATDLNSIIYQRHLLLSEQIKDGQGNQKAYTEYEYDNYSADNNHAAVVSNSGMVNYDGSRFSSFNSQHEPRGNVTKVSRWAGGTSYITAFSQYDNAGNVIWTKDPRGNVSTVSYVDNFGDGSNPDSGVGGTNGATFATATQATNALGQQAKSQYNYTLGAATGAKDPNGVIAKTEYDSIGRPVKATAALGLAEQVVTEMIYPTASSNVSMVSKQLDATRWLASKVVMDGFDRPVTAYQSEDGQKASSASFTIQSETSYDGMGRVKQVSNPYRPGQQESAFYTTTEYDVAGRVIKVKTPDNAEVNTYYNGAQTLVKDQAGKERMSETNALGQLSYVWEITPTDNSTESITFPNHSEVSAGYKTKYDYDTLSNLITVTQRKGTAGTTQTRSFAYDALSRLTSAMNPESGTIIYDYDANSNLWHKTDARGVTATYVYDALNRVMSRSYSDTTTPTVTYSYDTTTIAYSIGRLTSVNSNVSATNYDQFDALGRVKQSQQTTDGQTYSMSYAYNLAGAMTSETYPSGRVITTGYDNAGRLSQISGTKTGESNKTYASQFSYTPHGAIKEMKLGNNLWEHTIFNARLQPVLIGLGTSQSTPTAQDYNRFRVDYYYGTTDNNGNVQQQTISVPDTSGNYVAQVTQYYDYDQLNRLKSAEEKTTSTQAQSWKQTFIYDRYGNRSFDTNNTSTGMASSLLVADPLTNRLALGQGSVHYDGAGNLDVDFNGHTFSYDAENKQTKYDGGATAGGTDYKYDGDGRRVKKVSGTGQQATVFVYDVMGQMVAEYDTAAPSGSGGTNYLTADNLGTPRVITDASGNVKSRHDYAPFGEELGYNSGLNLRSTPQGYAGDNVRQKFTQKERDSETRLDYFQARYYSSAQGRFTSADNFLNDTNNIAPSSWNLYTYVRNNPLRYTDPTGEKIYAGKITGADRDEFLKMMNDSYGCSNCASIDKNGYLQVDTKGLSKDVLSAAQFLTDAINDKSYLAIALPADGRDDVNFAQARQQGVEINGKKYDAVLIDFKDFKAVSGDKESVRSFTNFAFAHEVAHLYPPPGLLDTVSSKDPTGPVENKINEIRLARGLPLRATYSVTQDNESFGSQWFGPAKRNKAGQIERNVNGGIQVESKKIINWNLRMTRTVK